MEDLEKNVKEEQNESVEEKTSEEVVEEAVAEEAPAEETKEEALEEAAEEKRQKEKERIRDLKISVFCYAVRHRLNYNEVVEMIKNKTLTFDDIERDEKEYEGK